MVKFLWSNNEILVKYGNFRQLWKFWSNNEILVKYGKFRQLRKLWSNNEILVKYGNFKHLELISIENVCSMSHKHFCSIIKKNRMLADFYIPSRDEDHRTEK